MEDQIKDEILELDEEQLQELLGGSDSDKLPPIEIPMEWYDTDQFYKGIEDASYISGYITAMLNAGVSESFILDFLLNKETIKHNKEVAIINKEMNVEMAKNQKVIAEKHEL